MSDDLWGEVPWLLWKWEIPSLVADSPLLEEHYQGRIKAALEFALTVDDFDELVDPRYLYECCLGHEPSVYVLSKISQGEKRKAKIGKSVWDDPATTLRQAHNVITDDELKGLSSIPSHELVLGESLHLTTNYLSNEEKVVVANSKVDSVKAESSRLRKDLIEAMDQLTKAKEKKDKEVQAAFLRTDEEREKVITRLLKSDRFSDLQFEQYFKDFELLRHWMMKHHSHVADFVNLDFEAIDTEILADEVNEKKGETTAKTTEVFEEEGTVTGGANDEAQIKGLCRGDRQCSLK
ncbi:hypothetical protein SO802_002296 [Lithocarpus litseifolius]|uniref:Uncharacterized protein n=1 Tax=Lithocarpus litseifolius TaxID=425828 RepID=A0AAW2DZG6_9ROSI